MTLISLIIRILAGALTLYFIISEARYIITADMHKMLMNDAGLFSIVIVKAMLIFFALPILYLLKFLDHINAGFPIKGEIMSGSHLFFQAKLFYWMIYILIFILIIMKLFE